MRVRLFGDGTFKRGSLTLRAAGYGEALLADRGQPDVMSDDPSGSWQSTDAIVRAQELYAELAGPAGDLRVGFSRVVWGRLDELQPGDVINPLDLSKFFFEGRSEARLPVLVVRGRWHFKEGGTLEGLVVPKFQAGHFDQLDEPSSAFSLVPPIPGVRVVEPGVSWTNLQGGVRVTTTTGRVDWGLSAFRGFEAFPLYAPITNVECGPHFEVPGFLVAGFLVQVRETELEPRNPETQEPRNFDVCSSVVGSHPRTSMIAGDFESVAGAWGIRGEVVGFLEDHLQRATGLTLAGRSLHAGVGVDRRTGAYRISASTIVDRFETTDVTFVGSAERTFARDTRVVRGLGLFNAAKGTAFLRAIAAINLRDNLWLEGSAGLFAGDGDDVVGVFHDRDFLYARLKYYF